MPWTDLSEVTGALTRLLELNIENVLSPGLTIDVVGTPPDQLGTNVSRTLSLYLHHSRETAHTQNLPGPGSDRPNIQTAPLGLDLFYVLTAHQRTNTTFDSVIEQRLMGFAMKTLHDFPVVTDATEVAGQQVFQGTLRGRNNRLNIELRKLEPDQAFAIWTTGDRQFARLAAYYQVGLVLLEPDPPRRFVGLVLSLGAFVTPIGHIVLRRTRSDMTFTLPPSAGGGVQTLRAEPAQPSLVTPPDPVAVFTIFGENLVAGLRRQLVLENARWQRLTPPAGRVVVDAALNSANGWTFEWLQDRANIRVGPQVTYIPSPGAASRTIDVFPGTYIAQIEAVVSDQLVAGVVRSQSAESNAIAFGIAPRILNHTINAAQDLIVLNLNPAFSLNVGPPDRLDIQVVVDGAACTRRTAAGAPAAGEFTVQVNSVTVHTTFPVTAAGEHLVRVMVERIDAQPYWVTTP